MMMRVMIGVSRFFVDNLLESMTRKINPINNPAKPKIRADVDSFNANCSLSPAPVEAPMIKQNTGIR